MIINVWSAKDRKSYKPSCLYHPCLLLAQEGLRLLSGSADYPSWVIKAFDEGDQDEKYQDSMERRSQDVITLWTRSESDEDERR